MAVSDDQSPLETRVACGARLIRATYKYPVVEQIAKHFHVEQIAHDYFLEWHEASTDEERCEVWRKYRRDVNLGVLTAFGIDATVATTLHLLLLDLRFSILFVALVMAVASALRR